MLYRKEQKVEVIDLRDKTSHPHEDAYYDGDPSDVDTSKSLL